MADSGQLKRRLSPSTEQKEAKRHQVEELAARMDSSRAGTSSILPQRPEIVELVVTQNVFLLQPDGKPSSSPLNGTSAWHVSISGTSGEIHLPHR